MGIEKLFNKCPVLPAEPTISIARYLRNIRQTVRQANEVEERGETERAALLQIRILQLICKTLPTHPEYELAENQSVVKEMRSIAHTGFANVERLANLLSDDRHVEPESEKEPVTRRRSRAQRIEISRSLLDLFEKIAVEHTTNGLRTIAVLGGRPEARQNGGDDTSASCVCITALVIPSQMPSSDTSIIRYEADITDLLDKKGLTHMGFIEMCPDLGRVALTSSMTLARLQKKQPSAIGVVIAPQDTARVQAFSVNEDYGLDYLLTCAERNITPAEEVIPRGQPGKGKPIWSKAQEVELKNDSEPAFKLYDLRPLAAARDEHDRKQQLSHQNDADDKL